MRNRGNLRCFEIIQSKSDGKKRCLRCGFEISPKHEAAYKQEWCPRCEFNKE